jgi:cytoplasmic iron level regulating protein YaaA (DUF328/UPF0246 family)
MKIIISPTKIMDEGFSQYLNDKEILYKTEYKKILSTLKKLTKKELKKIMKIERDLLDTTYNNLKNYKDLPSSHAFITFNGLVFKGLQKNSYKDPEYRYIEHNVRILDALHGVLEPGTLIRPYRLDMKMNIGINLYKFWDIKPYFKDEEIINLASSEYSKMVEGCNLINISFLQEQDGVFINQATYSKQARGKFLNYLILNKIENIKLMKKYQSDNYTFNESLSNDSNLVFTRQQ